MEHPAATLSRLPVGIARLDREHRIVEVNDLLVRTLGIDRDSLIGRTCQELEPGASYFERWDAALDACFDSGEPQRLTRIAIIDGTELFVDFRFVIDVDPDRVLAVATTNLPATRLVELLENQEQLLRSFLDHAPVFAWLRGAEDHVYRMVNQTYLSHYGLEHTDVVGKTLQERWPGPVGQSFAANDAEVAASGESGRFYEFAPDPDGTMHRFLNVKFPFRDASGQAMIGSVGMDVTAHERLEGRLSRLEKAQDVAALALGAVHDLANDLTIILAAAQTAHDRSPSEEHDRILVATERAISRVQDLRLQGGPSSENTDLEAVLTEVVEESHHAISVSWSGHADSPIRMHPEEVRRVFDNLLRNAEEASGRGGRVEISLHRSSAAQDGPLLVRVQDDGPGVPAELADTIFDALVSTKGRGRGLGLAGVRALLRRRGGSIRLVEAATEGACFELLLPMEPG